MNDYTAKVSKINKRGLINFLLQDIDNIQQVILELLDNSMKALLYESNKTIQILNNSTELYIQDNGMGINPEKIDSILSHFEEQNSENNSTLSKFGIGLKSSLYYKMRRNNPFSFILSSWLDDNNEIMSSLILITLVQGEGDDQNSITYKTVYPSLSAIQLCNKVFNNKTGTLIFSTETPINFDITSNKEILDMMIQKIENMSNFSINPASHDDKDNLEILQKLYSPLITDNFNIHYNNEILTQDNFIKDTDTLIFDIPLYRYNNGSFFKTDDPTLYLYKKYEKGSGKGQIHTTKYPKTNLDINNLTHIANVKFYKAKPDKENCVIQYTPENNRVLQRNNFSQIKNLSRTVNTSYMRCDVTLVDENYYKTKLLNAKKLPKNPLNVNDLNDEFLYLNRAITRLTIEKDILSHFNWEYTKLGSTFTHRVIPEEPPPPSTVVPENEPESSHTKKIINDIELTSQNVVMETIPSSPSSEISNNSSDSDSDNTLQKKKNKQKKRGRTTQNPGGYIYLFTLKNSKDWNYGENNQIAKFGITLRGETPEDRLKDHIRTHPTKKIEILGMWKIHSYCKNKERDCIADFQIENLQYDAIGTTTSEFIYCGELDKIKNIINSHLTNSDKILTQNEIYTMNDNIYPSDPLETDI